MISVIIPAYNEEKMIINCIESLKQQDCHDEFEIIVVDNGSQDNTAHIAILNGVRVVSCVTKGVTNARQAGAEAARGDILIQADADTIYPAGWLRRVKMQFDKYPGASAIVGTFTYQNPPWWGWFELFFRSLFGQLSTWVFGRSFIISGANFAFRKQKWIEVGGYDPAAYSSDQIDIAARLEKNGKIIFDRHSIVYTSTRAVEKSVPVLILDLSKHLYNFAHHSLDSKLNRPKKRRDKTSSASAGTYLGIILPFLLVMSLLCGPSIMLRNNFKNESYRFNVAALLSGFSKGVQNKTVQHQGNNDLSPHIIG